MSWWDRLTAWGAQIEAETAAAAIEPPMAPGSMPMIVGVYVGLVLGTMEPERAGHLRRSIEAEMAAAMGQPPEALEEQMRQVLAAIAEAGR